MEPKAVFPKSSYEAPPLKNTFFLKENHDAFETPTFATSLLESSVELFVLRMSIICLSQYFSQDKNARNGYLFTQKCGFQKNNCYVIVKKLRKHILIHV